MADSAFQRTYREETIMGFEKGKSLAQHTVTTEFTRTGNEAYFLVADSGGATATTRGIYGELPTRAHNMVQTPVTLEEWHDVPEMSGFRLTNNSTIH